MHTATSTRRPFVVALTAALIGTVYATGAPQAQAAAPPTNNALSAFERCQLESLDGPTQRSAECAIFSVAENPGEPEGRKIPLYVARIKSLSPAPASDPVVLIAGGPGGSAVEMYLNLGRAFAGVLDERDILLVDQRGTGRSHPLTCSADLSSLEDEPSIEEARTAAANCLAELDADPRYYTTSVAVTDLDALREAAGYEQLNLYGVSYGTRVAQQYLRRYPQHTRTVVLDGVVPPTLALGPGIALNAQTTLDSIFTRCAANSNCAAAFPTLSADFTALAQRLRSNPPVVAYTDPTTGEPSELKLQYGTLAVVARLLSYAPETAALIPYTLQQAANANYAGLTSQAVNILQNLSSTLSYGMHNAVMCTEDAPFIGTVDRAALEQTYLGASQTESILAICEEWPRGIVDDDIKAPLQSDTPVLLLSGEFDPITPPAYAEQAAEGLSNSHHFVAPGQGHGVIARGCISRLVQQFFTDADIAAVVEAEDGCIARQRAMPFFVNSMGPEPQPQTDPAPELEAQ